MSVYKKVFRTYNAEETETLGKEIAKALKPGDVLALYGDLAVGKTTLTRGLTKGFHSNQLATSPTFTLINEYPGALTLYHIDCYRIKNPQEILYLGFEEYLDKGGIVVIEWPQKIEAFLPENTIRISLNRLDLQENIRDIVIESPEKLHVTFSC